MKIGMKRWIAAVLAVACVILAASACCRCRSYQRRTQKPLEGTPWQLQQMEGRTVRPEDDRFTLVFYAEGRLAGKGACNRIMGSYVAGEKGEMKIAQLASTRMACPGLEGENAFIRMLEGVTHFEMDGPMLLLLRDGELCAVFQEQAASAGEPTR